MQKKRNFSVKIFQKVPKNAFFGLFFQNFACGAKNLAKIGTKPCFGRARKIYLVDLKKIPPPPPSPRENPRSAPDDTCEENVDAVILSGSQRVVSMSILLY